MFRHKMFEPIHLTVLYLVTDFYALASYYYLTLWMPIMLTILKNIPYTIKRKIAILTTYCRKLLKLQT